MFGFVRKKQLAEVVNIVSEMHKTMAAQNEMIIRLIEDRGEIVKSLSDVYDNLDGRLTAVYEVFVAMGVAEPMDKEDKVKVNKDGNLFTVKFNKGENDDN